MQARMAFVLATITLDAMGVGLILPILPDLLAEVQGVDLAGAAAWGGWLTAIFAAMQFLFAPVVGNLSDRFGRRPILLGSLVVLAADYAVMATTHSIWVLMAARAVAGIGAATYTSAAAIIADSYPPEERAARFGLISAGFGIGFVLGPALGGILGDIDTRAPFWGAAALALANLAFGAVALRETLALENRRPFDLSRANPLGGFRAMAKLPGMGRLLATLFLFHLASWVYPSVWAYYTRARFGFDPGQVGFSLTVYGIGLIVVQMVLIRPILRWLGETRVIYASLGIGIAGLVYLGLIQEAWMLWAILPFLALGDLYEPAMQGVMSGRAAADQQGELQGVNGSLQAVATIAAPPIMTQVFAAFTQEDAAVHAPGAPFLLAAVLMVGAVALFATRRAR